ncbi:MAG: bifunctional phosphoribosylaminoimidazolecarboxamide formyltransferase/IMP cyclohydrolase [Bacteroidia bacterium]|nr:bifunctional phosphoribosylaminoimidazolecarboxamide formyltransferase/IMP cyclohydrolase [Bacteroidia bacterium]
MEKRIETALLSIYDKTNLEPLARALHANGVQLYATGGTLDYVKGISLPVQDVSQVTGFPAILGGRVKTLHPKIFGGILAIRGNSTHEEEVLKHDIPLFDLVVVDLYPFEETLRNTADPVEIIEKIDIGGVSLIRAAAKNFHDVLVIPATHYYEQFLAEYISKQGSFSEIDRRKYAGYAFQLTARYDSLIADWFESPVEQINLHYEPKVKMRYGENPHQAATFFGNLQECFTQLHGKELSYNNLLDIDAAFRLIREFTAPTFAIIKHTNPCGIASRSTPLNAWEDALACDPISAFGGIIITNQDIPLTVAESLNEIFYEVLIAPHFSKEALELLSQKKNRILLKSKPVNLPGVVYRSCLNGLLMQEYDAGYTQPIDYQIVTTKKPAQNQFKDIIFGEKVCKHLKSNAIAIVYQEQLIGSGIGQTSRIDALNQAIHKAEAMGFILENATLVSDAFFPFTDGVRVANAAGIKLIIQPGGSVRDKEVIEYCEENGICMVFTGNRHFHH